MDLQPYIDAVRHELSVAAAAGGPDAEALADRLTAPLDSAIRLALLEALSEAAEQITREVFGYVWENPDAYDPRQGSMRSWLASLTHGQAVHRLRQAEYGTRNGPPAPVNAVEAKVRAA
ncbi:MAG TPA: sigma factor, partial [Mycobacterium sp.]|nr:sigma factor [Mycobacterium sp.]